MASLSQGEVILLFPVHGLEKDTREVVRRGHLPKPARSLNQMVLELDVFIVRGMFS